MKDSDYYFCIKINQANVFGDLNESGEAIVWCEVTWAGITKETRHFMKPNVNETLKFKIPIPPDKRRSEDSKEKYLTKELQSKSEFEVTVWADTFKMYKHNMGGGKACLKDIASSKAKVEDVEFIDPISQEKTTYQTRVFHGNIRLESSFWPHAANSVSTSIWFQKDLPRPGVDLSKLKPRREDVYPDKDIKLYLTKEPEFCDNYAAVFKRNFLDEYEPEDRLFEQCLTMQDQYNQKHFLPFYLCKITNPDQTMLNFDDEGNAIRGVRTLAEIAHYVRCIPYLGREEPQADLWTSPDFTGTIQHGSEDDHALLMASIFRTCKVESYEEYEEFEKAERQKRKTADSDDGSAKSDNGQPE
jgi:hypothetical protein